MATIAERHISLLTDFGLMHIDRKIRTVWDDEQEKWNFSIVDVVGALTDQWKLHNVEEGIQYTTLTDIIYQHWAGKTAKEYKQFKGLKKENLRDNMTNEELVLNMLAELSTTSITKSKIPQTLEDNMQYAMWHEWPANSWKPRQGVMLSLPCPPEDSLAIKETRVY